MKECFCDKIDYDFLEPKLIAIVDEAVDDAETMYKSTFSRG